MEEVRKEVEQWGVAFQTPSGVGDLVKTEVTIKAFSIQQTGNKS